MAGEATKTLLGQVEVLFRAGSTAGLSDGRLLEQFAARSHADDVAEAAFAVIVDRHAAMVLQACRRVLADEHAAEDAAQATFLVLARRARSIRNRESVAGWLHGVALRVAAKERVARARRRVRERRGGAIAAERMASRSNDGVPELWEGLDQELSRLPESFRTPLVLCYLEGFTQEQAAARLGWPVGTLQSRLARGKTKLKSSLVKRGIAPTLGLLGADTVVAKAQAAPTAWVEATLAAALAYTQPGGWAVKAGASPATAGLAWEVLRDMGLTKLKGTLVATFLAATATIVFAAMPAEPGATAPKTQAKAETPKPQPLPEVPKKPAGMPSEVTLHGTVRDESGKLLVKVWVGDAPMKNLDIWENPRLEDIRERNEPFRNARGAIIPPGPVGKYFEYRTRQGTWEPVNPEDIGPAGRVDPRTLPADEVTKPRSAYAVRVAKGDWWMPPIPTFQKPTRTDSEGRFTTKVRVDGILLPRLHFASPDYRLQETFVLERDYPIDQPINIVLRPTRLIRGRVVEVPKDHPRTWTTWTVESVDPSGKAGQQWQNSIVRVPETKAPKDQERYFYIRLPVGKYLFQFRSPTLHREVDLQVPEGNEPLDVDLRLESLASVRSVGKPAMEIEAYDLEGRPVKLADFRGKVVVLHFWATWSLQSVRTLFRLRNLEKRFSGKPLVILALHDGTVASADAYRRVIGPIKEQYWNGEAFPLPVLIDRPQTGKGNRPDVKKPDDHGAGRSSETYEVVDWPSTFVIARDGTMLGMFSGSDLGGVLADQFGLPRSRPKLEPETAVTGWPKPRRNVRIKGKVVGPDNRPVAGASVTPQDLHRPYPTMTTGLDGGFAFTAEEVRTERVWVRVEAPNLAPKMDWLETNGKETLPLNLGEGVVVTGRLWHEGKPLVGIPIRLYHVDRTMERCLLDLTAKTDAEGRFRFAHVSNACKLEATAEPGRLKGRLAVVPRSFETGTDGTSVELGDFAIESGRKLAGRVILDDGQPIPPGTLVIASNEVSRRVDAPVDEQGRFDLLGILGTEVSVVVRFPESGKGFTPGYRLSAKNRCLDPVNPHCLVGRLDRDIDDLRILLEPGSVPERPRIDQGLIADFEEAKAGPITGVPTAR